MRCWAERGFTLVELVVAIVIMGIMALGTVSYITTSSQSYQRAASGDRLGSSARILVERLARELRSALPNSVRATPDGACIEFVPLAAAGTYLTLAQGAATSMAVIPLFETPTLPVSSARASVYPSSVSVVYNGDTISPLLSGTLSDLAISGSNPATAASAATLQFSSAPDFPADSPQRRWFVVSEPVSFCLLGDGRLYRYQGDGASYTYRATQWNPPPLTTPAGGRWLVADKVFGPAVCGGGGNTLSFRIAEATLQRNAVALLDLCLKDNQGGSMQVVHEVQLRNVP